MTHEWNLTENAFRSILVPYQDKEQHMNSIAPLVNDVLSAMTKI